jgi:hypothetical protein
MAQFSKNNSEEELKNNSEEELKETILKNEEKKDYKSDKFSELEKIVK